jgi:hypothetical protein
MQMGSTNGRIGGKQCEFTRCSSFAVCKPLIRRESSDMYSPSRLPPAAPFAPLEANRNSCCPILIVLILSFWRFNPQRARTNSSGGDLMNWRLPSCGHENRTTNGGVLRHNATVRDYPVMSETFLVIFGNRCPPRYFKVCCEFACTRFGV